MRIIFCMVFIALTAFSYPQEGADSSATKLKAGATISLNSNGIASVPAFSLGDPAALASISLAKGWFSYEPTLAYGLDGRPWFIDNWFRIRLVNWPAFEFRTGMNISSFFSDYKIVEDTTILQGQRYFAFEVAGTYRFAQNASLSLMYWNDRGQEPGTLKGHFIDLVGDISSVSIGKHVLLGVNLQLFYVNYTGTNDGLFVSPKISAAVRKVPLTVFFQAIQALASNMTPFPAFSWNIGLAYAL
jgi:hypothetical protein